MEGMILGLIAGHGDLPSSLVNHCITNKTPFFIIALHGQTSPELVKNYPHAWFHLGQIGKILAALKEQAVTHIVMAGAIHRPSWSELKLDWKGTRWLAKNGTGILGDDGLLRSVINLLEAEGFHVLGPADILDEILMPEAVLTLVKPDEEDWQDIHRGIQILHNLSSSDVGQAVIVQQDIVLGIEAVEGTMDLINRCGHLRRTGRGGTLVKMAKQHQTHKVDLPTIGVHTISQAHAAGLRGIAVSAGSTQILDKITVIKEANSTGIYLIGISPSCPSL
jgi:DUF1009 family protein